MTEGLLRPGLMTKGKLTVAWIVPMRLPAHRLIVNVPRVGLPDKEPQRETLVKAVENRFERVAPTIDMR